MSVKTILSDVIHGFEKVFSVGSKVAVAAEPTVDVLFPGVSTIFNSIANEAALVEAASVAANAQSGTGAQKLATVVANVTPSVVATATANGLSAPSAADISSIATGVVAILNALKPATPATTSPAA